MPAMIESLRPTEHTTPDFVGLDTWPDLKILQALIDGQERAIAAVQQRLPQIATAAHAVSDRLKQGGRLFYAGAGTSIRIAVQDGSELPATFGLDAQKLGYLIAGDRAAMFETRAEGEDSADDGLRDAAACGPKDVLIAIAASGNTPYTIAAAKRARQNGCHVIAVVNAPNSALAKEADIEIYLDSGPEVIAGSTRLGAGTAQKATLNLISTLANIHLGAVHDGLMVNLRPENQKLKIRARRIVEQITGASDSDAQKALDEAGAVKPAVLLCAGAKSLEDARALLASTHGNLRLALAKSAARRAK
jgi:N-acetylmuramic acid 6-phosphate etherase